MVDGLIQLFDHSVLWKKIYVALKILGYQHKNDEWYIQIKEKLDLLLRGTG